MANIHEMIAEVEKLNPALANGFKKYVRDHSYGLVYERNLPDAVRLWTKKPEKYDKVHILPPRGKFDTPENFEVWHVSDIVDGKATLVRDKEVRMEDVSNIVTVVDHTDVIYPGLKVIDKVERGDKNSPYHMLINAENYHALEMLRYAYAGRVDCIYIDPPYNTGNRDWKYNNNYVSQDDQYRHSKWLMFMERRLRLAKDLLNPKCSVMIVTIDEKEYLRLGMLLEQLFPEARIQMVSSVINPKGVARQGFYRSDEYLFFLMFGEAIPAKLPLSSEWSSSNVNSAKMTLHILSWTSMMRRGNHSHRVDSYGLYYAIYVNPLTKKIEKIGNVLPKEKSRDVDIKGLVQVLPIRSDGSQGCWQVSPEELLKRINQGRVKVGSLSSYGYVINYLPNGAYQKVLDGSFTDVGRNPDGSLIVRDNNFKIEELRVAHTNWKISSHNASEHGSVLNSRFLIDRKFPFPKSLYAVEDCLRFFVANNPNALIVDFFAGSGTTAHATMLLNRLDNGHRQCISITNNEVGSDSEKVFIKQGLRPTDREWQDKGIAKYITWERIKAAITGIATDSNIVKGSYKFLHDFPMSEGFRENAIFCELTYENMWDIRLDRAFNAISPLLWAMAGSRGKIIEKRCKSYATTDNYAVLFRYDAINDLVRVIKEKPTIQHVFVVTDDQQRYLEVIKKLPMIDKRNIHRLYESYLRSFEIKGEGGLD